MKNLRDRFTGVFTALVTPFDKEGNLDLEAFSSLVQDQLEAGIAGLVPVGTTGEAATLNEDERDAVIQRSVELADGKAIGPLHPASKVEGPSSSAPCEGS